ncbi:DHH family phosphoesterase [Calditerricola satsumensis]|uniref:Cyclic-di-AMP phosphodiesterase n=1 Tax=Calditerricola satsumensis TaxID=373054 RepID=A0A8J3B6H2_9BACI|nr:DHH family phosphoesterase [Calditerricola satsumensis]GGJ97187.1 DHH family phosphoesterase [Calditerricola satsumensis]
MPKFLLERWHGMHMRLAVLLCLALCVILTVYNWMLGLAGLAATVALALFVSRAERAFRADLKAYLETIQYRVKKAGDDVLATLPIGVALYSDSRKVEWANPAFGRLVERDRVIGEALEELLPVGDGVDWTRSGTHELAFHDRVYELTVHSEERMVLLADVTELCRLKKRYRDQRPVFAIIHLDNLDEVTQGMSEQQRGMLLSTVTAALTEWAGAHDLYLRRFASDKFFAVLNEAILSKLEQTRFDILDIVRELHVGNKIPITLSIGVAAEEESLAKLGQLAQSTLDIVLGRGGDQAAVRRGERIVFYGGKTNAVEKRTRVRARVISHALRDLILESENVLIMGHRCADMDAVGAAIGVLKMVQAAGREGYIVLDEVNPAIERLMDEVAKHEALHRSFVSPDEALDLAASWSLLVVVDTHRPSMVMAPELLEAVSRVVVIDHHRRGEEFVDHPVLIYMEPYASSTCELVTELLQYQSEKLTMDRLEASALLAGIVVDTRSFSMRTGARTFEAASFLRRHGADPAFVQHLLKEDPELYHKRVEIIKNAQILPGNIALCTCRTNDRYAQLVMSQAADELLSLRGVQASFVVNDKGDGTVHISARSLGDINVQVIMEKLGGGGHLTSAAAQLKNTTLDEAVERLKQAIRETVAEEGGNGS